MGSIFRATSLALTTCALFGGTLAAQTGPKFGYVNSAAILAQAPGRAEAEAQFNSEVKVYQGQLQRMSDSLQLLAANFDKESPKLDSATRDRLLAIKELRHLGSLGTTSYLGRTGQDDLARRRHAIQEAEQRQSIERQERSLGITE